MANPEKGPAKAELLRRIEALEAKVAALPPPAEWATIRCNRRTIRIVPGEHTGHALRVVCDAPESTDLWLEQTGESAVRIEPTESYAIADGARFFTSPRYLSGN